MMDLGAKAYVRWSIKQTDFYVNNEKKIFKNSILKYFSPLGKRRKQALEKHMGVIFSRWKKGKCCGKKREPR